MLAILISVFSAVGNISLLDRLPPPVRRVFAAEYGQYGAEVFVAPKQEGPGEKAVLTLFTYDKQGDRTTVWESTVSFVPTKVLISDKGRVIAFDDWWHPGTSHSMVCFTEAGTILVDFDLASLLTKEEIALHVRTTASSKIWMRDLKVQFSPEDTCVLEFPWGKKVQLDLASGKATTAR